MSLFRRKTYGLEAIRAIKENWGALNAVFGAERFRKTQSPIYHDRSLYEVNRTADGWVTLNPGEWVLMLEDGTVTTMADDRFREEYEPVDGDPIDLGVEALR